MFYSLHLLFRDFICDDVCAAENLSRVAVDDLSLKGFCEVNSQLGFSCAGGAYSLDINREGNKPIIAQRVLRAMEGSIHHLRSAFVDSHFESEDLFQRFAESRAVP